ncbi:MAG TPA: FAD:protein FMN transferase, partial [Flavihumibacter sp.]|nr:FAD:protein FMN transferase [Flavihumibacter sp.]
MPEYKRRERLMGNQFEFTIVVDAPNHAPALLDLAVQEIARIEALLTTYAPTSQTNLINQQAGLQPVAVDAELFQLIQRANTISRITNGAFDLSYGSIDKRLWNFDTQMDALPDLATAKKMVRLIDYRNIVLDEANQTVFLKHKGMRIGFGGIGKGYAAACAKNVLIKAGVQNGIVNASGD